MLMPVDASLHAQFGKADCNSDRTIVLNKAEPKIKTIVAFLKYLCKTTPESILE